MQRLYQSKNDEIKVRALVGLCKLGSSSGTDASWRPFQDGSTINVYLLNDYLLSNHHATLIYHSLIIFGE